MPKLKVWTGLAMSLDTGARRLGVSGMFDAIAPRYDLLNRVLSLRRDVAWRRRLAVLVGRHRPGRVLDLATGTGDVLAALAEAGAAEAAVGLDMSAEMLALAQAKLKTGAPGVFNIIRGDAAGTAFSDGTFDAVTVAFGIRNMPDAPGALDEMRRVLKPGGRAYVLEFSLPANPLVRALYLAYFRFAVPAVGGWLSRNRPAYAYLNRSVEQFPRGREFCQMMTAAGFAGVTFEPLTFGIAAIYQGVKAIG